MSDSSYNYVQYGCGFVAPSGWINFDSSPWMRVASASILGLPLRPLARFFPSDALVQSNGVFYGDIVRGLPVNDGSACGVYASHVLEHLALTDCRAALVNTRKIMKVNGILRLVVPDLESRARFYVATLEHQSADASYELMRGTMLGVEERPRNSYRRLREAFGSFRHLWMWDFLSMSAELEKAGFGKIRRCEFGDSEDSMFSLVESRHRFVWKPEVGIAQSEEYAECAIECRAV